MQGGLTAVRVGRMIQEAPESRRPWRVPLDIAPSKNGVPIRLTEERWLHITEEHCELAGLYFDVLETIESPDAIHEGQTGELLATAEVEPGKHLVVVYREMAGSDGFVITAFLTRRIAQLQRRKRLWPQ